MIHFQFLVILQEIQLQINLKLQDIKQLLNGCKRKHRRD